MRANSWTHPKHDSDCSIFDWLIGDRSQRDARLFNSATEQTYLATTFSANVAILRRVATDHSLIQRLCARRDSRLE